jgi:hypothetical protein
MPTPYSPGGGSSTPLAGHLFAVQRVGHLDQDAGAVAHQLVGAHRAAVVQVLQDLQRMGDDGVALLALDVRHEADAAGVVLMRRVVQAGVLQVLSAPRWRAHRALHHRNRENRGASIVQCNMQCQAFKLGSDQN